MAQPHLFSPIRLALPDRPKTPLRRKRGRRELSGRRRGQRDVEHLVDDAEAGALRPRSACVIAITYYVLKYRGFS